MLHVIIFQDFQTVEYEKDAFIARGAEREAVAGDLSQYLQYGHKWDMGHFLQPTQQ